MTVTPRRLGELGVAAHDAHWRRDRAPRQAAPSELSGAAQDSGLRLEDDSLREQMSELEQHSHKDVATLRAHLSGECGSDPRGGRGGTAQPAGEAAQNTAQPSKKMVKHFSARRPAADTLSHHEERCATEQAIRQRVVVHKRASSAQRRESAGRALPHRDERELDNLNMQQGTLQTEIADTKRQSRTFGSAPPGRFRDGIDTVRVLAGNCRRAAQATGAHRLGGETSARFVLPLGASRPTPSLS